MRFALALSTCLALFTSGCFMDHGVPPDPPIPGVDVEAAISGATLGDDCPATGAEADIDRGACAPDLPCPSLCQQSNVQLAITTSDGAAAPLTWQVMRVTLHDFDTDELLQELTPREPRVWSDADGYAEWDELLPSPSDLSTTYDLSAPDWTAIGARVTDFWSQPYRVRMVVEIEGVERTLESSAVYRVSDIDT